MVNELFNLSSKDHNVLPGSGFTHRRNADGRLINDGTFVFTDTAADAFLRIEIGALQHLFVALPCSHFNSPEPDCLG